MRSHSLAGERALGARASCPLTMSALRYGPLGGARLWSRKGERKTIDNAYRSRSRDGLSRRGARAPGAVLGCALADSSGGHTRVVKSTHVFVPSGFQRELGKRHPRAGAVPILLRSSGWKETGGWQKFQSLRKLCPPSPSPRSCLTGRGSWTRSLLRRFRHELSQRLIWGQKYGTEKTKSPGSSPGLALINFFVRGIISSGRRSFAGFASRRGLSLWRGCFR